MQTVHGGEVDNLRAFNIIHSKALNDLKNHDQNPVDTHRFSQGNAHCAAGLLSIAAVICLEHEIERRLQDQHKALKALLCLLSDERLSK